ncbi:MAG: TolC family outer membrane protein, partial [Rhodospirillaceae bacterium]|nr:TolC family outer membrane protein [Rhodospirillaceae bacterium]
MRRGLIALFAAGLLGGVGATAGSSAVYALTLEEAVALAVQTNPRVGVVSNDRLAVGRELRQARALYLPQIDLRAAAGPEYTDNSTTLARGHGEGDVQIRKEASLTLSQLLFDGFYADSEVERQQARVRSAAFRVAETAQFVALDAVEAYLEVLRHRERVQIAQENVETHRSMLDTVRRRASGGSGSIGDVRQAETRLASAQSALIVTQGDLRDAEALFQRVVGQAPDTLSRPGLPMDVPTSVDDAIAQADVNSPTIAISKADLETAEALVKQQESSLYPDFRLELLGSVRDDADGYDRTDYTASALVVMRWNLYRGGADDARIREFKYRLAEAQSQVQATTRDVEEEVRRSWNAVQVAHSNVAVLTQELASAEQTRGVYRQQWELGQRSLLDLLDADNDVYRAHDNLITAQYAELFANYRLLASAGLLIRDLGVALPVTAEQRTAAATTGGTSPAEAAPAPAQ